MKKLLFLSLLLLNLPLLAKVFISPSDALKAFYPESTHIEKKNILLNSEEFTEIQKSSQVKLKSKIFKIYIAKKESTILGYGVLINRKVRSKNGVILYLISQDSLLKSIEIVAFNEPQEYMPSQNWKEQFKDLTTQESLYLGDDIATITGATLSARTITDGSRVAFSLYNQIVKEKQ